jgi:flagellar biosynthesis protein FlhB
VAETEQNKTEEPTHFKLKKAREKGQIARGTDLSFFAILAAFCGFASIAGAAMLLELSATMRLTLTAIEESGGAPERMGALVQAAAENQIGPIALLGACVMAVIVFCEIIQLRGLAFSGHPLKPDFSRLDPAKGLKRLFSARMLKETLKSVLKFAAYAVGTWLIIRFGIATFGPTLSDADSLIAALQSVGFRLLFLFALIALIFSAIDQVLSRREFLKQMRMSRSEVNREHKDREGEPRQKQKRKQMHAEFIKQTKSLGSLADADMLIVNPHHYAIGLAYNSANMIAPTVTAKGRNRFALHLRAEAARLSVPIFEMKPLARALYKSAETGFEVPPDYYEAIARLYLELRRRTQRPEEKTDVQNAVAE